MVPASPVPASEIRSRYLAGQRPWEIARDTGWTREGISDYVSRHHLRPQADDLAKHRAAADSAAQSVADRAAAKAEQYLSARLAGLTSKLAALERVALDLPAKIGLDDLPVVVDALDRLDRIGRRTLGLGDGSGNPGKPTTAIQVNLLSSLQRPPDA